MRFHRLFAPAATLVAGLFASAAFAAPVPVTVNLTALRAVQTYNLDKKVDDNAYILVGGIAKGAEVDGRLPKDKSWEVNRKKPPVTEKAPEALWKGELADGEFALITVLTFQGKGEDAAKVKEFAAKLDAAEKPAKDKKTLASAEEFKKLAADVLKGQQAVATKVKDTFSREKNTDHFGGLFTILVWNNNGKLVKRLDPVGLTFGEHYGTDVKVYTKLKNTRNNVLVADPKGAEFSEQVLAPLSDDFATVRVKMLEAEYVKTAERTTRNVTDYLADVQVLAADKPVKWTLGGEEPGVDEIHAYWGWAE
jgi:hypothetical protein